MKEVLSELTVDDKGQGLTEYGLIISLVIIVVVGVVQLFGFRVEDLFNHIGEEASSVL